MPGRSRSSAPGPTSGSPLAKASPTSTFGRSCALSSAVSLNVDLGTTLTVIAGNLCRLFARNLRRYEHATPDTIWRHFLDDTGTLHITPEGVTVDLALRSHHPVLINAGYADLKVPIPWWDGNRTLQFRFPPR